MKRLGIYITVVVLIAGVASCTTPVADESVRYDLTLSSTDGGSLATPGEGTYTYDQGTAVSLVAVPATGYSFAGWTGDVDTVANTHAASTIITMNGDYSITATFEEMPPIEYTLTISSTEGGSVTAPGEGAYSYKQGTVVNLLAQAEEGYRFDRWTGDVTTVLHVSLASTSITIKGEYSITARFVRAVDYSALGKITRIEADPENGFHFAYYLYVPTSLRSLAEEGHTICLLVEPNNTGAKSDDQDVHDSAALQTMNWRVNYAEHLRVPLLIPTFPRPETEWRLHIQQLNRRTMLSTVEEWKRIDLQLISMIEDASDRLLEKGITIHSRVLMMGFSASGSFVSRFAVMHPDRVQAVAAGAPSGWPIAPLEQWEGMSLRYPVGIADLEEITGKEFDIEEFRAVPLYFYLGDADTHDSVPYLDCWDPEDQQLILENFGSTQVERWPIAESMYESVGCNSLFELYPGVGHEITSEMRAAVTSFLLDNMDPR